VPRTTFMRSTCCPAKTSSRESTSTSTCETPHHHIPGGRSEWQTCLVSDYWSWRPGMTSVIAAIHDHTRCMLMDHQGDHALHSGSAAGCLLLCCVWTAYRAYRTCKYAPSFCMPVSMFAPSMPAVPQIPRLGTCTTCKQQQRSLFVKHAFGGSTCQHPGHTVASL
jgi:hypothetical protein